MWCGRYGPQRGMDGIEDQWEDGIWIDITGVAHLFGGEPGLLKDLSRRLHVFGFSARIGLADTAGAAFALARYVVTERTPWVIAPVDQSRQVLSELPVEALRLTVDCVVVLRRLGLYRIGQLYDLPRQALAQRFRAGPGAGVERRRSLLKSGRRNQRTSARDAQRLAGAVLTRLDQALGLDPEPRVGLAEPACHLVRRMFAEPLMTAAGVEAAVVELAGQLCALLEASGRGGTRFVLSFYRSDGSDLDVRVGLSCAGRAPEHLVRLLGEKLGTLDAGFGIDVMTLAAIEVEPLSARQVALPTQALAAQMSAAGPEAAALIDRLSNRLGADSVIRLLPADSHCPERAERRVAALTVSSLAQASPTQSACDRHATCPPGLLSRAQRPQFLLPRPEPIAVLAEVPEGPPLRFTWRRLTRRVVRAEGPERIEPEWWRAIGQSADALRRTFGHGRPRDYYAIEDANGARYWVFRAGRYGRDGDDGPPVWFLHGVFG